MGGSESNPRATPFDFTATSLPGEERLVMPPLAGSELRSDLSASASSEFASGSLDLAWWNESQHGQRVWVDRSWRVERGVLQPWGVELADPVASDLSFECRAAVGSSRLGIEVHNFGRPLELPRGRRLYAGESRELRLPARFWGGRTLFETLDATARPDAVRMIELPTAEGRRAQGGIAPGIAPGASTLAHWFDSLAGLQRLATGSAEFRKACASAVIEPGGLDGALILERKGSDWEIVAGSVREPELGIGFPRRWVEEVARRGTLHYTDPAQTPVVEDEERHWVLAPYHDGNRDVRGMVFGLRGAHRGNARRGVRPLEACFVGLVAEALTAGTIRLAHETSAVRRQVLLEQAFPPAVAQRLIDDPTILHAKHTELTLLFADLRDSTRLSRKLSPDRLFGLLADVMNEWTRTVLESGGVVLDYFGDGLAAFWNAPIEQRDHARAACCAAMAILERMPGLRSRWEAELGEPLRMGMGIHTGPAMVGNAGSRTRLKYGPRGESVHLTARIESATKALQVPMLISEATYQQLQGRPIARRVARMRLPGVEQPMTLYEPLASRPDPAAEELRDRYESALAAYETGQLASAWTTLRQLRSERPEDRLIQWLGERVERMLSGRVDRRQDDRGLPFVPLAQDGG